MRTHRMLLLSIVLVGSAGCTGTSAADSGPGPDTEPAPDVTIGCVPGDATTATLADVCTNPASYESQRVTLAGDWQQGQGSCSTPLCSPGVCCGACSSDPVLTCPDGSTTVALQPRPELNELPSIHGACGLSVGCPIYTSLGCAGSGGSDATDCSAD